MWGIYYLTESSVQTHTDGLYLRDLVWFAGDWLTGLRCNHGNKDGGGTAWEQDEHWGLQKAAGPFPGECLLVFCQFLNSLILQQLLFTWETIEVPTGNFQLIMRQSKFNTDASHLTYISKWDLWRGDCRLLSCLLQCLWLPCSVSRNATKCFTAHRQEETICCLCAWLIRCSFFYFSRLEAGGYFLDNFDILCLWLNWCCSNK